MSGLENSDKEKLMSDYLLGELSENERSLLEERFFTDDDYFAELLSVEDSLVEKYLKGELSPAEISRFEKQFLSSPKRRERVAAAGKLNHAIKKISLEPGSETPAEKSSPGKRQSIFAFLFASDTGKRLVFALTAIVIVSGILWLWWQRKLYNDEISRFERERVALQQQKEESVFQTNAAQQQSRKLTDELQNEQKLREESEEQIIELQHENERIKQIRRQSVPQLTEKSKPAAAASIITFLLAPGLTRDIGGEKFLRLTPAVRTVIFNLNLPKDEYEKYQISLETPEGRQIWRRDNLKKRQTRSGKILAFPVPARLLPQGVYILTLSGKTPTNQPELINRYAFHVANK